MCSTTKICSPLVLLMVFLSNCAIISERDKLPLAEENPLLGSWELTMFEVEVDGKSVWRNHPQNILYQKHITPTHFMWVNYDVEADQLLGAGGGTYTYKDGKYTEHIDFFFPPGANELGQSIPFSISWEEGLWHHLGYAKQMMLDKDSGTPIRQDSSKINEYWTKISNGPKSTSTASVLGSWRLETYREASKPGTLEYPPFVKYQKHITPTHFIWVIYNGEGDEIYETGCGTYTLTNDRYIENIQMMYPKGSGAIGSKVDFTYILSDDVWHHMGYLNRIDNRNPEKPRYDLLIDEKWRKIK